MRSIEAVKVCIEPHFHADLTKEEYKVETIAAHRLLTYNRLDIAFKLLYLEMQRYEVTFAKDLYEAHIKALTLGSFSEPGDQEKVGIERFIDDFHRTFENIRDNGFDAEETLIPLSRNGTIANGAHRVASAIFLDKDVDCVRIDTYDHIYDYDFFYKRGVSRTMLDAAVTKFTEYASDVYLACIWPTAVGKEDEIAAIIPSIIYKRSISLTPNGAHNLLSQLYYGEAWLGDEENDFSGSKGKLVACFKTFDPVRIIAFQAASLTEVLAIKEHIRVLFGVGKHAVHITDTKKEAIHTARIVFNENSIHFLNHARPNRYLSTHKLIDSFKASLKQDVRKSDKCLLDDELSLSLYGLREAKEIHSLSHGRDEVIRDGLTSAELIFDPKYYFYFNDLKFIAFEQLYKLKKNSDDLRMMKALIENRSLKARFERLKQAVDHGKIRARQKLLNALKMIGVYAIIKGLYAKAKAKAKGKG